MLRCFKFALITIDMKAIVALTCRVSSSRRYVMTTRRAATEETRRRILASTVELSFQKRSFEIVLTDVAARAGVSVQSVLRHFGSRDGLFDAAVEFARATIVEERSVPVGEVDRAVAVIVDHYELRGDAVLNYLAQEAWDERIRESMDDGRRIHREWVAAVFAPQLEAAGRTRQLGLAELLAVATDVYTWKLLRRDRHLTRQLTEQRMRDLTRAVLRGESEG